MAQWEREEIGERLTASIPIRAKRGTPIAQKPSYGYHLKDGKVVPHPDEAPVRKLIFKLFLEHQTQESRHAYLERPWAANEGRGEIERPNHQSPDPRPNSQGYVPRQLHNRERNTARLGRSETQSEWVIHKVEPIVSVELWEAMQCDHGWDASGEIRVSRK